MTSAASVQFAPGDLVPAEWTAEYLQPPDVLDREVLLEAAALSEAMKFAELAPIVRQLLLAVVGTSLASSPAYVEDATQRLTPAEIASM
jgi:hypothetical protein